MKFEAFLAGTEDCRFLRCYVILRNASGIFEDPASSIIWVHLDDGSSRTLRNISTILQDYTALNHRKKEIFHCIPYMPSQLI